MPHLCGRVSGNLFAKRFPGLLFFGTFFCRSKRKYTQSRTIWPQQYHYSPKAERSSRNNITIAPNPNDLAQSHHYKNQTKSHLATVKHAEIASEGKPPLVCFPSFAPLRGPKFTLSWRFGRIKEFRRLRAATNARRWITRAF